MIAGEPATGVEAPLFAVLDQEYEYDWFGVGFVFAAVNVIEPPIQIVGAEELALTPSAVATVTVTGVRVDSQPVTVFNSLT
jgi:hypothetical protein